MTYNIDIRVDAKEVNRVIDLIDNRLQNDLGHWMRDDLHDFLEKRASERFANEGDDASGAWAPLKPATWVQRARKGFAPAHPINVRTHDLQRFILGSAGSVVGAGTWNYIWPDDPPSGELMDKMQTAQTGRARPSTVPRPVVALGAGDYSNIVESLAAFIVDGIS